MQVITNWLNGSRNFYTGRAIYNSLGTDAHIKELLQKGATTFANEALAKALEQLNSEPLQHPTSNIQPPTTEAEMPASDDAVLQAYRNEWLTPYMEMNRMRVQLHQWGNTNNPEVNAKRKELAFAILAKEQDCMVVWAKRRDYIKNGAAHITPTTPTVVPTDPLELAQFIDSCKKNIRRNRDLGRKHPDRPQYPQRYQYYKELFKLATGNEYNG